MEKPHLFFHAPITNFSPFTFGSTSFAAKPLPIELVYFNAEKVGSSVELAWKTASEINNDYFTIERTIDGENFEIVNSVKGAGNSYQNITYQSIDNKPFRGGFLLSIKANRL